MPAWKVWDISQCISPRGFSGLAVRFKVSLNPISLISGIKVLTSMDANLERSFNGFEDFNIR